MIIDLPSTSSSDVAKRMVDLRERHGAVTLGRVLTLVLLIDEEHAESAIASANHASHEHPCRIIAVIKGTSRGSTRLDAQIRVGGDAGASEVIVLRTFGPLTAHPVSVVVPLLLPDAPIVAWWPAESPEVPAEDPVGALAQRRITDADRDPLVALRALSTERDGYEMAEALIRRLFGGEADVQEVDTESRDTVEQEMPPHDPQMLGPGTRMSGVRPAARGPWRMDIGYNYVNTRASDALHDFALHTSFSPTDH
jgi:hypothetical protein